MVKGEGSLLSCIESGTWDLPVPECVQIPSTTTTKPITTTTKPKTITTKPIITITTKPISTTIVTTTKATTTMKTTLKTTMKSTMKSTTTTTTSRPPPPTPKIASVITVQLETVPSTPILKNEHPTRAPASQPFKVKTLPEKRFWSELKQLYFYGCFNNEIKSFLCARLKNPANYTDLTLFELPDTSDFKHMDQNLLTHLMQANEMLNLQPDLQLSIETLFPFILYGRDESVKKRMPSTVENAYRFVLCLYIDTILLDKNLNITFLQHVPNNEDNITQKLKYFIARIASKVYDDYTQTFNARQIEIKNESTTKRYIVSINTSPMNFFKESDVKDVQVSTARSHSNGNIHPVTPKTITAIAPILTSEEQSNEQFHLSTVKQAKNFDSILENESMEESCQLESLPDAPPNSYISEIKTDNETIFNMPDIIYLVGPVSIRTRAYFVCKEGYRVKSNSVNYFECTESSKWVGKTIACEGTVLYLFQNLVVAN